MENQREDVLGLTCREMESLSSGLAGLPGNTASLLKLKHPLNSRGCGVIGVREAEAQ